MKLSVLALSYFLAYFTNANPSFQVQLNRGYPFPSRHDVDMVSAKSSSKAPLPANEVLPNHYVVHLTPIIDADVDGYEQYSIPGKVSINVTAIVDTNTITLNALDLDVDEASLNVVADDPNDTTDYVVSGHVEIENEFYVLTVEPKLQAGRSYIVSVDFTSYIATEKLNGIYLTGYIDPDTNEIANVLTTQFEASAARQAFPCFDEPWAKATFKFFVGYDSTKYIALCNSEELNEIDHPDIPNGWKLKEFDNTVKMSSYLVAILVANYTYAAAESGIFNKPVKVYGPPHLMREPLNGGDYGATKGAEILTFFENYFGIDYKMPKMDSVAVPAFWFGAMENWGLNFYRESILMYYSEISSEVEREGTTSVLAHELTHQWFGNLVTAEFWDQIWLNEGFATYFAPIATSAVTPEYDSLTLRHYDINQLALIFDATPETHPLINYAHANQSYDTLMEVFDRITYEKAGSLIRMMEGFLTPETMKTGLINYLTQLSFDAADQDDLFLVLTKQGHSDGTLPEERTVKDIMDTWSHQSGFPLVRVTKSSDSRIFLSQERFVDLVKYSDESPLDPSELWEIPVGIVTADEPEVIDLVWIEKDVALKVVEEYDATKWILVNADGIGFYRVLYDAPLFNLLLDQLNQNASVISTISRSQIVDDYFTFVDRKFIEVENALELTKYLGHELDAVVWFTVFSHLEGYINKLSGTEAYTAFEEYFVPKLSESLRSLGIEQLPEDKGTKVYLRAQLLDWACALRLQDCLTYAGEQFLQWDPSPYTNPIPVDIRPVVYCGGVQAGTDVEFEMALNRYQNSESSAKDKALYLNALGCANDPELPLAILETILEDTSEIAETDKIEFLQRLGASSLTRSETTNFFELYASEIITVLGVEAVAAYVETLTLYIGTEQELEQIERMIKNHSLELESIWQTLESYLQIIRSNIQWRRANEARLHIWFAEN